MNKEEIWFWLCSTPGVFRDSISRLLEEYGSAEEIYANAGPDLVQRRLIAAQAAESLVNSKKSGDFFRRYEKMEKKEIRFIYYESELFPENLKTIPENPFCLYVKGNLPNPLRPSCAIVGARACSEYGRKQAVEFSSALAEAGVQIISGMAAGIDSIAQKAAIDAGGSTFAVLGGGTDVIYPAENMALYYEIIAEGGGIISEYPPGTSPLPWQFPHRNRIISGLSQKLLIIEARKRSGTLSTARHALEQGRDICALPGRITDPLSEGCNELIYDGAGILIKPEYVVNDFFTRSEAEDNSGAPAPEPYDETGILRFLSLRAKGADEIAKEAGMDIRQVTSGLAMLELSGLAKEVGKDFYVRT